MNELLSKRYLLLKRIGSGGMAEVYLAMDTILNREVALKILRGDLSHDPVALLRFQREANAASGLNHPNIVDVYDVGEDQGRHYIVMEMMRGSTLKELVGRRGSLDKYEAVSIMEQLVRALIKAHDNGVIHRDIKPQNILVKDDGTVKITDFGIALAGDALQLTQSDSVLGSVHYMAPECSRGEGASNQSDIYALGVVFYELLTGDVPYRGETPVEIAMKHMRESFPSVKKYNPSIPNSIVNIIAKATHKNKLHRYKTAQEFLVDLEDALQESRINEPLWEASLETDEGTKLIARLDSVEESHTEPKTMSSKKKMGIGIGVLSVLVVIMVLIFNGPKNDAKKAFSLPDLEGLTIVEASVKLNELDLRINPNHFYEYSDVHEAGIVTGTKPGKEALVYRGDTVRLSVSEGKTIEIIDYSGKTVAEVEKLLENFNISFRIHKEVSSTVPVGRIIRQESLNPGDRIQPSIRHELVLYVSSETEMVVPNDIIGRNVHTVKAELEDKGIVVELSRLSLASYSEEELDRLSFDVVIRSTPNAGTYYVQSEGKALKLFFYDSNDRPEREPVVDTPQEGDNE